MNSPSLAPSTKWPKRHTNSCNLSLRTLLRGIAKLKRQKLVLEPRTALALPRSAHSGVDPVRDSHERVVEVRDRLLNKKSELGKYFNLSCTYVDSLEPKPKTRKKAATKK